MTHGSSNIADAPDQNVIATGEELARRVRPRDTPAPLTTRTAQPSRTIT